MAKVFISYSRKDQEFVDRLHGDLIKNGIETWIDTQEIKIGEDIPSKIDEGMTESDFVIVVLSSNFMKSEWCKHEVSSAITKQIESGMRTVLPVKIGRCKIPGILKAKNYADFVGWRNDPEKYKTLFSVLLRSIDPSKKMVTDIPLRIINQAEQSAARSQIESGYWEMKRILSRSPREVDEFLRRKWRHIENEWITEYRANRGNRTKREHLFEHLRKLLEPVVGYGCALISGTSHEKLGKCLGVFQVLKDLPQKAQIDGAHYAEMRRQPYDGMALLFYGWSFYAFSFEAFGTMRRIFTEKIVYSEVDQKGISYPLIADMSLRHMEAHDTDATKSFDYVAGWIQNDSFLRDRYGDKEEVLNHLLQVDFVAAVYFSMLKTCKELPEINTWYYPNFRRYFQERYFPVLKDLFHQNRRGKAMLHDLFGLDYEWFKSRWQACANYLNEMRVDVTSAHTLDENFFSK